MFCITLPRVVFRRKPQVGFEEPFIRVCYRHGCLERKKSAVQGGARIAVQFVINYDEGGENAILHGDKASEAFLSEIIGADAREGVRHMSMESIYEYGSRVGVWRLMRMFGDYEIPVTFFAIAIV